MITEEDVDRIFEKSVDYMTTLNLNSAKLMKHFGNKIKACTDITGFGIKGHGQNLSEIQTKAVDFRIHTLPVMGNLYKFDKLVRDFKMKKGLAAETSGGLLIVLKNNITEEFIT